MPRLNLRIVFALIFTAAIWLSAGQLDVEYARAVRAVVWFMLFAVSLFGVIHLRGRAQAFWMGPLLVLILKSVPSSWRLTRFFTNFSFTQPISAFVLQAEPSQEQYETVNESFIMLATIAMCLFTGWVSMTMFKRGVSQPEDR